LHNSRLFERALLSLWLKKLKGYTRFSSPGLILIHRADQDRVKGTINPMVTRNHEKTNAREAFLIGMDTHFPNTGIKRDSVRFSLFLKGVECVIKVISHSSIVKANQTRRLNRELQAFQELDHPDVVKCSEIFQDGDMVFIVMEKCGEDLFTWLTCRKPHSRRASLRIFLDFAEGPAHVHRRG
jgi:serine/threonine protein kinase